MTPVRIERRHLPAVAALEAAVFHAPWSEKSLELLCTENAFGYVCLDGERAVSYGGMTTVLDEGQITDIATLAEYRRRGLAEAVLGALFDEARARGLKQVTLEVRESNLAAIALYEKFGFVIVGRRPRFYRSPAEAAVLMTAAL